MAGENLVQRPGLARRAALLAPLALGGCSWIGSWFTTKKTPLPGKRELVVGTEHGLAVDKDAPRVMLPPPVRNAAWPQAGGNPSHAMGHLAANASLREAWRVGIGEGGGYRRKILAQPVVANGLVYTMDSDAVVSAFELSSGRRVWRTRTRGKDVDSTNVGGGIGVEGGTLYAINGLADALALDAARGTVKWRRDIGAPGRSAPTIVEGRLFFTTIEDKTLALATADGHQIWEYQAASAAPAVLGRPAPAFANGLLVAAYSSGELACLHADSGAVVWTENLGSPAGSTSAAQFSAIRGRPAISNGRVFATGMGGSTLGLDLPSGRRLWEREVGGADSPWVAGDWLFLVALSQELAAISVADGRVAWVSALPRWDNPKDQRGPISWWGPVLLGDRLVVASTNKNALSVSPYTGAILGRQKLSAAAAPLEPVVADGTLLIVSDNGQLLALR